MNTIIFKIFIITILTVGLFIYSNQVFASTKIECKTNKDCWDKNQNCYYACENNACNLILTESETRLPEYPNCLGDSVDINYPQDVLCAPDKKLCTDGSYVERAGFKCDFVPCPEIKLSFWGKILNWFKNIFN